MDKLADRASLSPHYFSMLFKHSLGVSPRHYVLRECIYEAQKRLGGDRLSISQLALSLGFSDQSPVADNPDVVRCWRQAEPARQLPNLQHTPILIVTSDAGYHSPYDHCTSEYLTQAGVKNTQMYWGDVGIHGNGHMMMIEKNNLDIAAFMLHWLEENVEQSADR
jgi:AraC-like DNA-binding protein